HIEYFFVSSRRRHTRSKRDWSSDVCSSDLAWKENTALIEESNARYETFASTMQTVWNSVRDTTANIGNAFAQSGDGIIGKVQEVVQNIEKMTDSFIDAEGGITQTGQRFVAVATTIGGITTVLGIAGAAFMAFGPAGPVTVGVVAGLGVIIAYIADLVDALNPNKSGLASASDQVEQYLTGSAEESAKAYLNSRDEIEEAMADIAMSAPS